MVYPHRGFAQPSWLEGGYDKNNNNKQQQNIRPHGVTPGGLITNKETAAFYKTSRCNTGRPNKLQHFIRPPSVYTGRQGWARDVNGRDRDETLAS